MKNAFFQLPFHFDEQKLLQDLGTCLALQWKDHFNKQDYDGSWTSIALRSPSGNESDINTYTTEQGFLDTPLLAQCPYFQEVVNSFDCPKETIRLLCLNPNSFVKEHNDYHLGYEYGFFRLHIPIKTDSHVSFRVSGHDLPMRAGECWYANFHLPHSVTNNTPHARIHLVIDGLRNEWSDALFKCIGFDFEEAKRITSPDEATKKLIIARLKEMDTAKAEELIKSYEL